MSYERFEDLIRKIGFAVTTFLILLISIQQLYAHEFYDPWCCNGKDCKPYYGKVEETPKGYYIPEFDALVPYKKADGTVGYAEEKGTRYNVPEDGAQYHICVMPWEPTKLRCFYAKPGGV